MDQVLAENRRQYETMKANIDLVNLRCHDLRHQLDKLQSRLTESEISALREAIDLYDSNVKTGNEVLDVVLYSTMLKCMESGISFTTWRMASACRSCARATFTRCSAMRWITRWKR